MIPSGLITKYREIVNEAFYQDLGKNIILHYSNPTMTAIPTNAINIYGNDTFDALGNPVNLSDMGNRNLQSATGLMETETTATLKARVRWVKARYVGGTSQIDEKVCQINAKLSDKYKMQQAKYITIEDENGASIKLEATEVKTPIPYGLGPSYYYISFWKPFNE